MRRSEDNRIDKRERGRDSFFAQRLPRRHKLHCRHLRKIAEAGIDVDMISQFLPNSSHAGLSFTVSDDDFGGVLEIATQLRAENKKDQNKRQLRKLQDIR